MQEKIDSCAGILVVNGALLRRLAGRNTNDQNTEKFLLNRVLLTIRIPAHPKAPDCPVSPIPDFISSPEARTPAQNSEAPSTCPVNGICHRWFQIILMGRPRKPLVLNCRFHLQSQRIRAKISPEPFLLIKS